jgi:hypothetical protein
LKKTLERIGIIQKSIKNDSGFGFPKLSARMGNPFRGKKSVS